MLIIVQIEDDMPRMTAELLVKSTGQAKRKRDESLEQFLRRITHLYCSEKGIEVIVSLYNVMVMINIADIPFRKV